MPERTACDEAIQFSRTRLQVTDADLKQGQVEMFAMRGAAHVIKRPWGIEGGFAVVYKFRTAGGKLHAVRCFRVPMNPDMQMRYELIGPYFAQRAATVTTNFKYYEQGILIKEMIYGAWRDTIYPVIVMEWVEGTTMLDRIDALCQQGDRAGLEQLVQYWIELLHILEQAKIAHGDLSGSNVMVRPDGRLVLIDYDGSYIPAFANMKQVVIGQADYQHPQMTQRAFNEQMDHFSALVIYTALVSLQVQPSLWQTYTQRDVSGKLLSTNLLFTQQDYAAPQQSALFSELEQINDTRVVAAVQALKQACHDQIDQVAFPWTIIDPHYMQKQALAAWRAALNSRSAQNMVTAYHPVLDKAKDITAAEREILKQAQDFMAAYATDQDEPLVTCFDQIRQRNPHRFSFTQAEQQRILLARQRMDALTLWRDALRSRLLQNIVTTYNNILEQCQSVTRYERNVLALARDFQQAQQKGDDEQLVRVADELQQPRYQGAIDLNGQEQQRVQLARQCLTALQHFRSALQSCSLAQIVNSYDPILQNSASVTHDERAVLTLANDFMQAYQQDNDQEMVTVWDEIQQAHYQPMLAFTPAEQQRLTLAQQRMQALQQFRTFLQQQSQPRDAQRVIAAYDAALLDDCQNVQAEEKALVAAAHYFVSVCPDLLTALQNKDRQRISSLYREDMQEFLVNFTSQQRHYINQAAKYQQLESALASNTHEQSLRLAREIEKSDRSLIYDARLVQARQQFIRKFDAKEVAAQIRLNELIVRWRWPDNDLIEVAFILWRSDRWPRSPQYRENGTQQHVVTRDAKELYGICRLPVYPYNQAYVQIYLAITDYTQRRASWFYSRGQEPTSRSAASLTGPKSMP